MKKLIAVIVLMGALIAGSEVKAFEIQNIERSPVVHQGIVGPCMPTMNIFGISSTSAIRNMANKGFKH